MSEVKNTMKWILSGDFYPKSIRSRYTLIISIVETEAETFRDVHADTCGKEAEFKARCVQFCSCALSTTHPVLPLSF